MKLKTRWFSATLLFFALSFCIFQIQATDVFMYLALARDFLLKNDWSFRDPYLYSLPSAQLDWVHEYLSYFLFHAVWWQGGWPAVILLKTAVLGATFVVVLYDREREANSSLLWSALFALAVIAASFRFIERSSLISDLFTLCLARWLIEAPRIDKKLLIPMGVLFALWIQFHPGFPVGVALVLIWALWSLIYNPQVQFKDLLWLGLPLAALLINPLGPAGVFYPVQFALAQAPVLKHFNFEWFPTYHPAFRATPEVMAYWALIILSLFLLARAKAWTSFRGWLVLFSIVLGASAVRFVPWSAFLIVMAIKPWAELKFLKPKRWAEAIVLLVFLGLGIKNLSLGYVSSSGQRYPGFGFDASHIPSTTVDFLVKNRIAGHLYNSHEFGTYLIWKGVLPIFHHGFVTDMDFYRNDVMGVFQSQARFLELAKKYDWTMLLIDKGSSYPYFYKILSPLTDWKIVAEDDSAYLIFHLP